MKKVFAIPTAGGRLTPHFGRCEQFAIVETENEEIVGTYFVDPPEHQPGTYPRFLASKNVDVIFAGGMGPKAQDLFRMNNIDVYLGIYEGTPSQIVEEYFKGQLETGDNACDH
jgi:predicted Fe-Mo cluster-binding NifX family protein